MRGKVEPHQRTAEICRITPAYAGKSPASCLAILPMWDHPRLCGEKHASTSCQHASQGSPPPMRGKVPAAPSLPAAPGITPAYAGKSAEMSEFALFFEGSPPPMRGKVRCGFAGFCPSGITPAYAGKSPEKCRRCPIW